MILDKFYDLVLSLISKIDYFIVLVFMTIESSFIPFPSEIILIPAGYIASISDLNIFLIIIFASIGSVFGALINYYIARVYGRKYLLTHKKNFFISKDSLEKSEIFFKKYGSVTTFFARLIPLLRQYISLPAGFAKMDLKKFIFYTFFGAFIWVSFLSFLGYFVGLNSSTSIVSLVNLVVLVLIIILIIVFIGFYLKKRF